MRSTVAGWIKEKDEMENRIEELETMLHTSGFGLSGGLIDDEGYPLNDVDKIFEIRSARGELASWCNLLTSFQKEILMIK